MSDSQLLIKLVFLAIESIYTDSDRQIKSSKRYNESDR